MEQKPIKTFGEALPEEIERVRGLITIYEQFPTGTFATTLMKSDIKTAEKAMIEGDIATMVSIYQDLKTYKA